MYVVFLATVNVAVWLLCKPCSAYFGFCDCSVFGHCQCSGLATVCPVSLAILYTHKLA